MYGPCHARLTGWRERKEALQGSGKGIMGSCLVAYLFEFFCTVINESPSADDGDSDLATGAVGMEVGLSPSNERGEEGWTGPEVTG